MVIISKNNTAGNKKYTNTHFRYGVISVIITLLALLFLNYYSSQTTQKIFSHSKETVMLEKCRNLSLALSDLDVLNTDNVQSVLIKNETFLSSRVVVTDPSGKIIYDTFRINDTAERYCLYPEVGQAMEGMDVFSWTYDDGVMRSRSAVPITAYSTVTGCVYIMEYDTAQGRLMHSLQTNIFTITLILEILIILITVFTAFIYSGKLRRILSGMHIIRKGDYSHKLKLRGRDELNLLADEFNELTDRLQRSENKRRQFVSDASHELKTPLASIKLLSDSILQNDMDMNTAKEFVSDIGQEADRLNRLSQKLLSLSKLEAHIEAEPEIIQMAPTIQRVVRMLQGIAESSMITINTDLHSNCPVLIPEDDLYQIVFNLAENGIKYNAPRGALHISLVRDHENAILSLRDEGVGIPPDSIDQIFERFYRVDKARSRKSGGSGLGLSIVRMLVEKNDGTIQVSSIQGEGSVFTVTFPIFDTEETEQDQ